VEAEEPRPAEEDEPLVDVDLEGGGGAEVREPHEEEETESERLAADFVAAGHAERTEGTPTAAELYRHDAEPPGETETEEPPEPAYGSFYDQKPLGTSTGVGSQERPRHRSSLPLIAILAVLVAATAGVLLWRARGGEGPGEPATTAAALPSPAPETETQVDAPPAAPAMPDATAPPRVPTAAPPAPTALPTPRPTARPAPTAAPRSASAPAAGAGSSARPRSRQGWLERAERDQKTAASDRGAHFTVQLELACEVPSLSEAFAHDRPAGSMWLAPTSFRGRTCFRVLWGRYPTREAAESGLAGAPRFFSTPRNRPMVVPIP
jgi:hypothetical protein